MSVSSDGVIKTRLRNGLEVRMKTMRTAPIVSCWLMVRVGSRNESAGTTGISHWVEHMQFKGTPTYPAGAYHQEIARVGGYSNAMTWLDWTAYYATVPTDALELVLTMESDRFAQSLYDPAQVESERTVIISEREGYENEPTFRLTEEVQAASFRVHSYHHEIIGDMIDLKTMSRVDLYAHYRRYYVPGNAILSIAGDIRPQATLRKIRKTFGAVPRTAVPPHVVRPEPAQRGERRIILEGPGGTSFLQVSYRTPAADHADYFPLTVLDSVLAGASNPSAFGSGISNKTSRLYQALVEGELASSLRGSLPATMDPFQYTIYATMRADRPAEDGLQRLDEELERVRKGGLSQAEISKAIKQARALFAYNSESVTTQAYWLAFSEMVADRTWFDSYLERLSAVTVAEVTDVARRYLIPANRVVGIYHPTGNASDE